MLPPREVVPVHIISTSLGFPMVLRHVLASLRFSGCGIVSLIVPTGRDVESRVSYDRGPVEMTAYKGKCDAHSCRLMERMD